MRVTALGAYKMKGTSRKTGAAYEMAKLVIRSTQETAVTSVMQRIGFGYGTNELDLDPQCIDKFNLSYPPEGLELDLEIGNVVQFGRLQSLIVGCYPVAKVSSERVVPVSSSKQPARAA